MAVGFICRSVSLLMMPLVSGTAGTCSERTSLSLRSRGNSTRAAHPAREQRHDREVVACRGRLVGGDPGDVETLELGGLEEALQLRGDEDGVGSDRSKVAAPPACGKGHPACTVTS